MNRIKEKFLELGLVNWMTSFLWFFGLLVLFVIPDALMTVPWQGSYSWSQTLIGSLSVVLVAYLTYVLAKKWGYVRFDWTFFRWQTVVLIGLLLGLVQLLDQLAYLWLEAIGQSETANNQAIIEEIGKLPPTFVWFSTTLLPAFVEELCFRGILMTRLFGRNNWVSVLVSSIVFAALHGPTDLPSWFVYGGNGFILAYLYKRTDNLAYPISLHFLNNALATWSFYFS